MSNDSLTPQADKSLVPSEGQSLLRLKGRRVVVGSAAAAVGTQVSQYFNFGVRILEKLDLADFTGTTFLNWLRWLFSPSGAHTLFVLFLAVFFIALIRTVLPKVKKEQTEPEPQTALIEHEVEKTKEALTAQHQSEIESIQAQHQSEIKTLRDAVDSLQSQRGDYADEIEGRKRAFTHLQRKYDTLLEQNKGLHAELAKLTWLYNLAAKQAEDISSYVVAQVRYCYYEVNAPIPHVILAVDIQNKSVFDIAIEDAIVGHIQLGGERLRGEKELIHNPRIPPSGEGSLTLKQRLTPEEVNLVAYCERQPLGAIYYFDALDIMIAGRTQFPEFDRTRLKLPQHIGSKDTPLSKEIDSLKAQLEEESAKRTKPDITGKIEGVYCETGANAKLGADGRVCFDHHFAVNTYVANRGAATTIERFKLVLKAGEHSYDAVREKAVHDVRDDEINWRKWGGDELGDLEKSNDEPLEYSRNGWLWFVVFRVENIENKAEMEIELYAVDKDGISYKLDTSPQPQWQRNPFKYKEMVDAERARMKQYF